MNPADLLSEKEITKNLTTTFIGRKLSIFQTLPSTNEYLKQADLSLLSSGHTVIANGQTQGRGQKERSFSSPLGQGIYLSILLKLDINLLNPSFLTICTAVSVTRAIEKICNLKTQIKWVNDVYCNDKKLCGILAESILYSTPNQLSSFIIGIGINTDTIDNKVSGIATSIYQETGLTGIRNRLIAEVLNTFESILFDSYKNSKAQDILAEYDKKLFIKEKEVLIEEQNHKYTALVLGVDEQGSLIIRDEHGTIKHLVAGTVHLSW